MARSFHRLARTLTGKALRWFDVRQNHYASISKAELAPNCVPLARFHGARRDEGPPRNLNSANNLTNSSRNASPARSIASRKCVLPKGIRIEPGWDRAPTHLTNVARPKPDLG